MKKKIISHQVHEVNDPTPLVSRVAFKKPLSAHERVLRAIRHHEVLTRMNELPGDDTFDSPPYEDMAPHQLMVDEQTGQEMTAGEHVMLQEERRQAAQDVRQTVAKTQSEEIRRERQSSKDKKASKKMLESKNESPDGDESESD